MDDSEPLRRVKRLGDLATEPSVPVSTRVLVEEDGIVYIGTGHTSTEIAARIGWTQPNIWIPAHALSRMIRDHDIIHDHIAVASFILQHPTSVHVGREQDECYFIVHANIIRTMGLLNSRSTKFVDIVVQTRQASDGRRFLRLFHLSPATRNKGGRQLWP